MTRKIRGAAIVALGAGIALTASACSTGASGNNTTSGGSDEPVTLTVWENNTGGEDGPQFWADVKKEYEASHKGVTIEVVGVPNEELDGKLQTALNGGNPPDVFLQRGGGKLAEMVAANMVLDLTDLVDTPDIPESAYGANTLDGKKYAVPMAVLPGGMFYSKDLFAQAGISGTPKTWDEFTDAVAKLKAANITPVALGAKAAWPAAHWYYWFALRECSSDTLETASANADLSDPCFLKAGEDLKAFADTQPFQEGFLTMDPQNAPNTADGLMATHKAAMQLMGAWEPGSVAALTEDGEPLPDMGFFPFPSIDGGKGEPGAMMAGVDGFSCSAKAPKDACVEFLNYLGTTDVQKKWATALNAIPAATSAADVVELPALQEVSAAYAETPFVSLWLDTRLGQNIGNALNKGIVDMLAGQGSPQAIVDGAAAAAAKG